MRLNHNMNSLSTYNVYKKNLKLNASALERVSSGQKINSAKDNPNKIGQSEQFRIQLKSLQATQKNLQDASSMLQTADGALQQANDILGRMRELAVSAADGTKSESDKAVIQTEINQLKANINNLAYDTEFNGIKMIGDSDVNNNDYPVYQSTVVGIMVGEQALMPKFNISAECLKDKNGNKLADIDLSTEAGASKAIDTIQDTIDVVSKIRGKYGALMNRFDSTATNSTAKEYLLSKADSSLRDSDIANEMMEVARTKLLNDVSLGLMAQSNQIPLNALNILERVR